MAAEPSLMVWIWVFDKHQVSKTFEPSTEPVEAHCGLHGAFEPQNLSVSVLSNWARTDLPTCRGDARSARLLIWLAPSFYGHLTLDGQKTLLLDITFVPETQRVVGGLCIRSALKLPMLGLICSTLKPTAISQLANFNLALNILGIVKQRLQSIWRELRTTACFGR